MTHLKEPITPGSKVRILAGQFKSMEKIVSRCRKDRLFLKDALRTSLGKKNYEVNIARSNCIIVERNIKKHDDLPK